MTFNMGEMPGFGQLALSHNGSAWNDLEVDKRKQMDSYTVMNLSAGIEKEDWTLTVYANNVTDQRGQTDILDPGYFSPSGMEYNESIIRPRSFGMRWAKRF